MCGILGTTYKKGNIEKAIKAIKHRGPDGWRIERLDKCNLAFVRLSIRDLSIKAMQPMKALDQNIWITYNGEIYGYERLKRELIKRGYRFNTTCDTEVILNAYLEYGNNFVKKIDGMFAIAIYDGNEQKIKLFRDRAGIKPMYYCWNGRDFTYASELKAITALYGENVFLRDNSAIYDYFTYRYIPEPKTLYKNVYKLLPAHYLTYDLKNKKIKVVKYWELYINDTLAPNKDNENEEKIRELIGTAVEEQLDSDVPVGTFLSGGIDSSIISAEIYRKTSKVHAFSMGFKIDNPQYNNYDETSYAQKLADLYNFPITYGKFDRNQLYALKKNIADWFDEPFADTSCFPTYMISKIASENKVPVILTGDGGDEVFGGYTRYREFEQKAGSRRSWSLLCDLYTKVLKKYLPHRVWMEEFLDAVSLWAEMAYGKTRAEKKKYRH